MSDGRTADKSPANDNNEIGDISVSRKVGSLNSFHVWAFGTCMAIGGQYAGWNRGLSAGFGYFGVALVVTAAAYACLVLCIAEISSALPFAGGSYGIARVTLGIFPGYLIACFDSLQSIIYAATALKILAKEVTTITELPIDYEILTWVICFTVTFGMQLKGGVSMWKLISGLALVSIGMLLVFILADISKADFKENAVVEDVHGAAKWFNGDGTDFMRILPHASWLFVGVEACNLACKEVSAPKKMVPRGYFLCMGTLVVIGFSVVLVACSSRPGILYLVDEINPLEVVFSDAFNINLKVAASFSIPAMFASVFGFTTAFSRQLRSMGESGIVNPWLKNTLPSTGAPYAAVLAGWAVIFVLVQIVRFFPDLQRNLFQLSMLFACSAYIAQLAGYIMFRRNLGNIRREFKSPLREFGACFAIVVFSVIGVSILVFQNSQRAAIVFSILLLLLWIYYYAVVKHRQFFSKEEQQVLFVAHVQKNNAEKRRLKKAKNKPTGLIPSMVELLPESWRPKARVAFGFKANKPTRAKRSSLSRGSVSAVTSNSQTSHGSKSSGASMGSVSIGSHESLLRTGVAAGAGGATKSEGHTSAAERVSSTSRRPASTSSKTTTSDSDPQRVPASITRLRTKFNKVSPEDAATPIIPQSPTDDHAALISHTPQTGTAPTDHEVVEQDLAVGVAVDRSGRDHSECWTSQPVEVHSIGDEPQEQLSAQPADRLLSHREHEQQQPQTAEAQQQAGSSRSTRAGYSPLEQVSMSGLKCTTTNDIESGVSDSHTFGMESEGRVEEKQDNDREEEDDEDRQDFIENNFQLSGKQLKEVLCAYNTSLEGDTYLDEVVRRSVSHTHSTAEQEDRAPEDDMEQKHQHGENMVRAEMQSFSALRLRSSSRSPRASDFSILCELGFRQAVDVSDSLNLYV